MAFSDKIKQHQFPGNHIENHMHQGQTNPENSFLSGIKQRLLSFIFQGLWNEERDETSVGLQNFLFIAVQYSPSLIFIAYIGRFSPSPSYTEISFLLVFISNHFKISHLI